MEKNAGSAQAEAQLILIVDDEIPIAEVLAAFVMELGYNALVAYNGQQALGLARKCWPALVITDQMMPLMNGIDLIRALSHEANVNKTRPLPVVLISAGALPNLMGVHVDALLTKPFNLEDLERVIRSLCGQTSS